jgi:beta-phosphoglucomutase-like phosphatase (HAD superfamily)
MTVQYLQVKVTPTFKQHLTEYAAKVDMSISDLVRTCVATATGYNLAGDTEMQEHGRPRKYDTDEERKEAARKRAEEKRDKNKVILDMVMKANRIEGAAALEKWLRDRGLLDDDESETNVA